VALAGSACVLAAAVGLALATNGWLRSASADDQTPPASGSDAGPAVQVLVLRTGRVLRGRFEPVPGGYAVATPHGRVVYPQSDVWCAGRSLREAYRQMVRSFVEPTPAQRLTLARWCLQYELYNEAESQLTAVLSEQPDNVTAKAMLEKLAAVLGKQPEVPESTSFWERFAAAEPPQTLGGLPRHLAAEYMQKIQPLLLNTCATGSCHGSFGESRFRLVRVDRSHRVFAERNLAAVLRYVDRRRPEQSELLLRAIDDHAARHAKPHVPAKRLTAKQLQRLREWVRHVAELLPPEEGALFPELLQVQATAADGSERADWFGAGRSSPDGSGRPGPSDRRAPALPRWGPKANRPLAATNRRSADNRPQSKRLDPFDPDVFNRGLDAPARTVR